jgi:hypothetical protein
MKTLIIIALSFVASIGKSQDTNAVIFCNGSSLLNAGQNGGYGVIGGLIMLPFNIPLDTTGGSGVSLPVIMSEISIFPNPSDGTRTVPAPAITQNLHASLYDERGAFVLDATPFMMREGNNLQFTLHGLPSGTYMLTLDNGTEHYSYKLSIRN